MSEYKLQAERRTTTGKKVKILRQGGTLPATVYGKDTQPLTISIPTSMFLTVYKKAGETGLIELSLDGKQHHVLIHTVQVHPVDRSLMHVEFHEVNLKEKVHADIPLELIGEASAINEKLGVLLPLMDHIEVEALPTELPEHIDVDISSLAAVNDQIIVGEITVPSTITVLTDPTLIVVKIGAFVVEKEPEPEVAPASEEALPQQEGDTESQETTDKEATETLEKK